MRTDTLLTHSTRRLTTFAQGAMLCASVLLTPAAQAYSYQVADLGVILGVGSAASDYWSTALGINDLGQAVGQSVGYTGGSAVDFSGVSVSPIFTPVTSAYGPYSTASDISNNGLVVGTYGHRNAFGDYAAGFVYDTVNHSFTDIGALNGQNTTAHGINSAGTVVGSLYIASANTNASFIRKADGTVIDLHAKLGNSLADEALDINGSGLVTGYADLAGVGRRGYVYDSVQDVLTWLDTTGGYGSKGLAINASGQVAGMDTSMYRAAAVRFDGSTSTDVGNPGNGEALGINDAGTVVGYFGTGHGTHAFVAGANGFHDLNDLINPASSWEIYQAYDINQAGQIAAWGCLGSNCRALLLTPVPEPDSHALALAALALIGAASRQSRQRDHRIALARGAALGQ